MFSLPKVPEMMLSLNIYRVDENNVVTADRSFNGVGTLYRFVFKFIVESLSLYILKTTLLEIYIMGALTTNECVLDFAVTKAKKAQVTKMYRSKKNQANIV